MLERVRITVNDRLFPLGEITWWRDFGATCIYEVFGDTAVGQMVIDWATHSLITYVITFHIKVIYTIQKLVNFTPAGSPPKNVSRGV